MKIENELCRKVFEHHSVLKGEISTSLVELCAKSGVSRDVVANLVNHLNAAVDSGSNKMVGDFQRTFKRINEEKK